MSLETKLYTLLSSDAGVVAIASDRVYPDEAPQNAALPYVVYTRISSGRVYSLSGYSGLENPRIQIDCYAETMADVVSLSDAVISAMRGATTFKVAMDDPENMPEEDGTFRIMIDFSIWNEDS